MREFDVLVLGGGGAGLFAASRIGRGGLRVAVLDHAPAPGKKILISGGGRCNFTNLHSGPDRFQSSNAHFARSALSRFSPRDFLALVEKHGIDSYEKKEGQLFCSDSAKRILDMLWRECDEGGVQRFSSCAIQAVKRRGEPGNGFEIETTLGPFRSLQVVVATGGLSIPKTGASGFGYELARQFGLGVTPLEPALVPFVMDRVWMERFGELSGVSSDVFATVGKKSFREALLFTHRGLSGPAILQASLYWREGESVVIDFLPGWDLDSWVRDVKRDHPEKGLVAALGMAIPKRLAQALCAGLPEKRTLRTWNDKELLSFLGSLRHFEIRPAGTEGFEKAEVTRGGVDTQELSSKTMEAKKVPGMYFIGEVVDVTGELGGHNFQWAWASAAAAAEAILEKE